MLRRWILGLLVYLVLSTGAHAAGPKRIALVVGNSDYKHVSRLKKFENDATDVATMLTSLGFDVVEGRNLDKDGLARTVSTFINKLADADIALFFYAGHAIQVDGKNYLAPIDARLATPADLEFEMLRLDVIHRAMEREAKASLIFLDACRDNPMAKALMRGMRSRSMTVGKGLAVVEAGVGSLISFSTQPGNVALDGKGRNSPYASALVKRLALAQEDVSEMLIGVRREVMQATDNSQVPWEHSSLTRKVYLNLAGAPPSAKQPLSREHEIEMAYWNSVKDSGNRRLIEQYLERYPQGAFAPLARTLIEEVAAGRATTTHTAALLQPGVVVPQPGADAYPAVLAALQAELKRVGCFQGEVNGVWGADSSRALANFNVRTQTTLVGIAPDKSALPIVRSITALICPHSDKTMPSANPPLRAKRKVKPPKATTSPKHNRRTRSAARPQEPESRRSGRQMRQSARPGFYHGGRCRDGNIDACRGACAAGIARACRKLRGPNRIDGRGLTWQRRVFR